MSILARALNQRTPVKNILVKKSKDKLTKAEIDHIFDLIDWDDSGFTSIVAQEKYYKTRNSIKQKLNNQLKELI